MKDISDVLAEQRVENGIVVAGEIIPEPPHPIAAFRDQELFIGKMPVFFLYLAFALHQSLAGAHDPAPRLMIFRMADPDLEIRVCPGSRRKPIEVLRRKAVQCLGQGHGFQRGILLDTFEQPPQEIAAAIRIVVPGIFPIECYKNVRPIRYFFHTPDQISRALGSGRVHVLKADQIRKCAVPKENCNVGALVGLIQAPPVVPTQIDSRL